MITESIKHLIHRIVNVFETGRPEGKYDSLGAPFWYNRLKTLMGLKEKLKK